MKAMFRIGGLLPVLLALCACQASAIVRGEIIGTYRINKDGLPDIIEVLSDGTYTHSFGTGLEARTQRGTWQLEDTAEEQIVTFSDFVFGLEGYGSGKPGFWIVSPERVAGRVRLSLDDDVGVWYQRQ